MTEKSTPRLTSKELIARIESLDNNSIRNKIKIGAEVNPPIFKKGNISRAASKEPKTATISPIVYRRDQPVSAPVSIRPVCSDQFINLEDAVSGNEFKVEKYGKAFLIQTYPCKELKSLNSLGSQFSFALKNHESPVRKCLAVSKKIKLEHIEPSEILFIDIETTGLGSCPLFLIGTLECADEKFISRQYLARNYAEESAVIAAFCEQAHTKKLLVSFNGKSFDIPFIRTRAAASGVRFTYDNHLHFDLLHESRKIWKKDLPNCRLQTLEKHVCGRARYDDIPGSEIPEAYHAYVRSVNAVEIVDILKHNMLDLVTLAELMVRMPHAVSKK